MERQIHTAAQIIELTRQYVLENFLYARSDVELTDSDALFERGIIDSMGVTELVSFVESEFGIKVEDDEITEQNFGTLRGIGRYVAEKQTAAHAA
jgi:acyl carrier protein